MRLTHAKLLLLGNQGAASLLPFTDDFARADGDVANGWDYAAGIWTISSNAVGSAPTLGTEVLANGNCETGDPPTGYSVVSGSVLSAAADERTGGSGSQSLNVKRGTIDPAMTAAATVTAKRFYKMAQWWKVVTATQVACQMGFSWWADTAAQAPDWTYREALAYFSTTSGTRIYNVYGVNGEVRFDDFSVKPLTNNHLFMTRDFGTPNVKVSVDVTITEHAPAGIVLCLDDQDNPQNYILVFLAPYKNATASATARIYAYKFVAGAMTQLADIPASYTPGLNISAEFANTTLRVYREGVQVGVDYTVSDAGIVSNTRHGLFDAGGGSMEDFAIE